MNPEETSEPAATPDNKGGHPVRVRRLRVAYRDILTASDAGENIFDRLARTSPISLVEHFTLGWTGLAPAPLALRREGFKASEQCPIQTLPVGTWYYFKAGSRTDRMIRKESQASYPDARRNYPFFELKGYRAYLLVIGNLVVRVWFDQANELARLEQQRHSLLDMIARSLLDYRQRELRHYQDTLSLQAVAPPDAEKKRRNDPDRNDQETLLLLHAWGNILESSFGCTEIHFSLARDIATALLPQQSQGRSWTGNLDSLVQTVRMDSCQPPANSGTASEYIRYPLFWGTENREGLFTVTLGSRHPINPHVRREMLLNQALFRMKAALEDLFERRVKDLRIEQDYAHFQRCKTVRSIAATFQEIKDHVVDALPEYGTMRRQLPNSDLFPRWEAWRDQLGQVFVDTAADPLEFKAHVRLKKLNEYSYLGIKTPEELMDQLRAGLRQVVVFQFDSEHPALARLSDPGSPAGASAGSDDAGQSPLDTGSKVLCFNAAATISATLPLPVIDRYERMEEMSVEYLESAGEGISRLFQSISIQSGIPNRSALVQNLTFMVNQVQYADMVELDVSSMDIVRFKIFNELFGHPFGDRVIRFVAHQLEERVPGSAFHVSGDEFYLVQCHTTRTSDEWVSHFFASKGITSHEVYQERRTKAEEFAKGIAVPLIFDHCRDRYAPSTLGTYNLADFIANFFTMNSAGSVSLKEYSRTGRDYYRVIHDPKRKVQALVDKTWAALSSGSLELGTQGFRDFVYRQSTLDPYLYLIPRLTVGTVSYNQATVLPYASDILEAADVAAGRNKK